MLKPPAESVKNPPLLKQKEKCSGQPGCREVLPRPKRARDQRVRENGRERARRSQASPAPLTQKH